MSSNSLYFRLKRIASNVKKLVCNMECHKNRLSDCEIYYLTNDHKVYKIIDFQKTQEIHKLIFDDVNDINDNLIITRSSSVIFKDKTFNTYIDIPMSICFVNAEHGVTDVEFMF